MDSFKVETHGAAALPMTKKQKPAPWDEDDDYLYELAALPMTKKPAPCDEENYLSLLQTHSLPPEDSDVVDKLLFRLESLSVVEEMVHLFLENAFIAVERQSALVNKVAAEKKALLNAREAINVNLYQELMMSSQTSCALVKVTPAAHDGVTNSVTVPTERYPAAATKLPYDDDDDDVKGNQKVRMNDDMAQKLLSHPKTLSVGEHELEECEVAYAVLEDEN